MDADYLLKNQSNEIENIKRIINDIISQTNMNDFITFEVKGFEGLLSKY
jgi:hypothetical protein